MNPDPRVRRGAHRTSRAASATLLPSLLAILAVTSLITALYVWRGEDAKPPSAAAVSLAQGGVLDAARRIGEHQANPREDQ